MAWEERGSRRYYYRVRRDPHGHLVKTYCGTGPAAQRAAAEDADKRATRKKVQSEQKAWEVLDAQVANLNTVITSLSHSTFVNAGLYKHHRGGWRKRRNDGHNDAAIPQPS